MQALTISGGQGFLLVCPCNRVTLQFIVQTRILLRVYGGAINNDMRITGINWDCPGQSRMGNFTAISKVGKMF